MWYDKEKSWEAYTMAATKKVGELVKEARTKAKLTQEQLAQQVDGVSASDIGKCERGEKDLSQAALKQIAKATGVTQKSLLEAPKNVADTGKTSSSSAKTSTSGKTSTSSAKTSSSGKTSSTSSAKTSSTAKTSSSSGDGEKLTTAEKRVLDLYRAADATAKKNAEAALKGTLQVAETAADKRVLELYHAADSTTKKNAEAVLKGTKQVAEDTSLADALTGGVMELITNLGKK